MARVALILRYQWRAYWRRFIRTRHRAQFYLMMLSVLGWLFFVRLRHRWDKAEHLLPTVAAGQGRRLRGDRAPRRQGRKCSALHAVLNPGALGIRSPMTDCDRTSISDGRKCRSHARPHSWATDLPTCCRHRACSLVWRRNAKGAWLRASQPCLSSRPTISDGLFASGAKVRPVAWMRVQ
jgi:hypothetical protein